MKFFDVFGASFSLDFLRIFFAGRSRRLQSQCRALREEKFMAALANRINPVYYKYEKYNFCFVRLRNVIYEYILNNFQYGEPIFLSELPGKSLNSLRQEMKRLTDTGRLQRLYGGVYYLPYRTILGTKGRVSMERFIEKKYLSAGGNVSGYLTGLTLANRFGFTTQNPACYEVCSNEATTRQRKLNVDGNTIIVYKPAAEITAKNKTALQFLDLMDTIDKYSEIRGQERKKKIYQYIEAAKPDFNLVKTYLPLYPDRVYRNLYEAGVMGKLV